MLSSLEDNHKKTSTWLIIQAGWSPFLHASSWFQQESGVTGNITRGRLVSVVSLETDNPVRLLEQIFNQTHLNTNTFKVAKLTLYREFQSGVAWGGERNTQPLASWWRLTQCESTPIDFQRNICKITSKSPNRKMKQIWGGDLCSIDKKKKKKEKNNLNNIMGNKEGDIAVDRWRQGRDSWWDVVPWRRLSLYRILPCRTPCRSLAAIHQIVKRQTCERGEAHTPYITCEATECSERQKKGQY